MTSALDPDGVAVTPSDLADAHLQLAGARTRRRNCRSRPARGSSVSPAAYQRLQGLGPVHQRRRDDHPVSRRRCAAGPSTSTAAADAIPAARAAVAAVARDIGATSSGVAGNAPVAADVGTISGHDLMRIIPIVMIVLALLLAVVLRSLVAPIYLVVSVGLSYLASLGLAVLVFELIGGQDGINFVLPFFMFIFIMALGQDYNILVMTRIREEAHHAPIRVAVRRAVEATGYHGDVGRAHPGRDVRGAHRHRLHPGPGDRAGLWPRGSCSTRSSSAPCWSLRWSSCWGAGTGGRPSSPTRTTATTPSCPTPNPAPTVTTGIPAASEVPTARPGQDPAQPERSSEPAERPLVGAGVGSTD